MTTMIRAANPIWYMVDHVGLSLNDEYYAFFLTNTLPYMPQSIYRDNQGATIWTGNIVQFQPSGTLPNNLYFDPSLTYRIEIRRGNSQTDELIWEINDYVPGFDSVSPDAVNDFLDQDNQISNPQFNEINFASPFTYTKALSDTYEIDVAPGWVLELVGTGTTTLTQIEISGVDASGVPIIRGNPPYALKINNNGWSECKLKQRFNDNGAIFSNGSIAMNITARATTTPLDITITYNPSSPGTPYEIAQGTIGAGSFQVLNGAIDLPSSTNTNTGSNAYVDMEIVIPGTGILDITNIQVVGDSLPLSAGFNPTQDIPLFREQTIERDTDYLFHYYKPGLIYKPTQSYLVGWDFATNPAQEFGSTVSAAAGVNASRYVWDEAILFQEATSTLDVSRSTNTGGIVVTNATATASRSALIQYISNNGLPLSGNKLYDILTQKLCSQLKGQVSSGTLKGTVSLAWTADTTPIVPVLPNSCISSIAANAIPALIGTWNFISSPNYGNNIPFTLTTSNDVFDFVGFDPTATLTPPSTATAFAIIVCFDQIANGQFYVIDYCSLNGGLLPTRPEPKSQDEVIRECQYYYEKSYKQGVYPLAVTNENEVLRRTYSSSPGIARAFSMCVDYLSVKRVTPIVTIYSNGNDAGGVSVINNLEFVYRRALTYVPLAAGAPNPIPYPISNYTITPSTNRMTIEVNVNQTTIMTAAVSASADEIFQRFQYTLDARLGKI